MEKGKGKNNGQWNTIFTPFQSDSRKSILSHHKYRLDGRRMRAPWIGIESNLLGCSKLREAIMPYSIPDFGVWWFFVLYRRCVCPPMQFYLESIMMTVWDLQRECMVSLLDPTRLFSRAFFGCGQDKTPTMLKDHRVQIRQGIGLGWMILDSSSSGDWSHASYQGVLRYILTHETSF